MYAVLLDIKSALPWACLHVPGLVGLIFIDLAPKVGIEPVSSSAQRTVLTRDAHEVVIAGDPGGLVVRQPVGLGAATTDVESVGAAAQVVVPAHVLPAGDAGLLVLRPAAVAGLLHPDADDVVAGAVYCAVVRHGGCLCGRGNSRSANDESKRSKPRHESLFQAIHNSLLKRKGVRSCTRR